MTKELFDQLLALLLPEMGDAAARKAVIESALFGSPVLLQIEWEGATWTFSARLLKRLCEFGEVQSGKPAIVALLEEVRKQVGIDRQAKIDALMPAVIKLSALTSTVSANKHVEEFIFPVEPTSQNNAPSPANLTQFRLGRVEEWSQHRYDLEKRFVNLTLLLDKGESEPQRWHKAEDSRFNDLRDVLAQTNNDPALVLLGAPGSGKSTLLRRLQLDHSVDRLRDGKGEISFFIQLNSYQASIEGKHTEPGEWLKRRWAELYPQLEPLESYLSSGRALLLLDALNEMPHKSAEDYFRLVSLWKVFAQSAARQGNRIIFTCRSLDYSASVSSKDLRVPQVEVQPMNAEQVREFLDVYTPAHAARVWQELKGTPQFSLYQTPYFLMLLCKQVEGRGGSVPKGRAALFTGFVRQALQRELDGELFQPGLLLDDRDHRKCNLLDWRDEFELPERGMLFQKFSELAFQMQIKALETESAQVRIAYDDACTLLTHDCAARLLRAGVALNVLDEVRDEILFFHQLLQEFFAARRLAKEPNAALVHIEWSTDKVSPMIMAI